MGGGHWRLVNIGGSMTHNLKIMMMDKVFDDESSYDARGQPETEHVVELLIVWMLFQGSLGLLYIDWNTENMCPGMCWQVCLKQIKMWINEAFAFNMVNNKCCHICIKNQFYQQCQEQGSPPSPHYIKSFPLTQNPNLWHNQSHRQLKGMQMKLKQIKKNISATAGLKKHF